MTDLAQTLPAADGATALRDRPIDPACKGFGVLASRRPVTATSLAEDAPALHEAGFTYPLLTLRESALAHNITGMADYCARSGVELAPHGKTMMAPQLAARQLAAGAWGITVATPDQLQTYYRYGVRRLLLANELVDPAGIGWLATALRDDPDLEVYCYVDSLDGVALLDRAIGDALDDDGTPVRLPVLIELGHAPGRTGARSRAEAVLVAEAAARTRTLAVAGVSGYEGSIAHHHAERPVREVAAFCRELRTLTEELQAAGLFARRPLLSAGGSAFFDIVVAELTAVQPRGGEVPTVVLRSGAYLTHDHGLYAEVTPARPDHARGGGLDLTLRPALELWASVLSRPEPELALLGAGRRDVSFDSGLPAPLRVRHLGRPDAEEAAAGMSVTALNDQHAYLQVPADSTLRPGDLVCLGISHPCTTFDKWRAIPVVDERGAVSDVVHTFF